MMARNATKPAESPVNFRLIADNPNPGETRGAYLERMRNARGMTTAQLADAMGSGVTEFAIFNAEDQCQDFAGPSSDWFWHLAADALNLPEDAFLSVPVTVETPAPVDLPPPLITIRERPAANPLTEGMHWLRHDQLIPSPVNARKVFDPAALDELAASIRAVGILQNMLAKPLPDGTAEIAAGERRWRAIAALIERGEWSATEANIPVMVRQMTEAQHRALMIIENLARRDLTALEEARGFAELQALDPDTYTTARMAADSGFNPRTIQQRLKLLTLPGPVIDALDNGRINVSAARALSRCPSKDRQLTILAGILAGDRHLATTKGIQDAITQGMVPVTRAKFDIQAYIDATDGHEPWQIVEFENGTRYFPNDLLFRELQEAWAYQRCNNLRVDGWSWARIEPTWAHWNYQRVEGMPPGAGCVIVLSPTDASVTEYQGLIPIAPARPATTPARPAPTPASKADQSQMDIEDLAPPPPRPTAQATAQAQLAALRPTAEQAQVQQADWHEFHGRIVGTLAGNPRDLMILMILDRGRADSDSLFARPHSGDCWLSMAMFEGDDGTPGPLAAAADYIQPEEDSTGRPPSEALCDFGHPGNMAAALEMLDAEASTDDILRAFAATLAETIYIGQSTLHPVWRRYATLRGIPLPAHFGTQAQGELDE